MKDIVSMRKMRPLPSAAGREGVGADGSDSRTGNAAACFFRGGNPTILAADFKPGQESLRLSHRLSVLSVVMQFDHATFPLFRGIYNAGVKGTRIHVQTHRPLIEVRRI